MKWFIAILLCVALIGCAKETTDTSCPLLTPPAPGWCDDGTVVAGQVDENGCQQPPTCDRSSQRVSELTKEVCESNNGFWNECASACPPDAEVCTLQCVQRCECGGIAGWMCPAGYDCVEMYPQNAPDALGYCAPQANV